MLCVLMCAWEDEGLYVLFVLMCCSVLVFCIVLCCTVLIRAETNMKLSARIVCKTSKYLNSLNHINVIHLITEIP